MERTIVAGKYTITCRWDGANPYADNLIVTERDAWVGGRMVATDTVSRWESSIDAEWIETANTRELIDRALFGQWTFGYPYVGITDGAMLCQECALDSLVEMADDPDMHTERDWITVTVLQEHPPAGEYCDGGCEIMAPHCEDCGSESNPLVHSDQGCHAICRDCLAQQLRDGSARREIVTYPWNGNTSVVYTAKSDGRYAYVRS